MAKQLDGTKLLPKKKKVVKTPTTTEVENKINNVHTPPAEVFAAVRGSVLWPGAVHNALKKHVIDTKSSLQEYVVALVTADLKEKGIL